MNECHFHQFDNQLPTTSVAQSPIFIADIKEESESDADMDDSDLDTDYQLPSRPSSVGSAYSTISGQKRKRGRPAKPLKKLPPASAYQMDQKQRDDYNRERNNEASRISRRNKRNAELDLESECDQLERRNRKLEDKLKRLQSRKDLYTNLTMGLATR
jgi:hypothetical protein